MFIYKTKVKCLRCGRPMEITLANSQDRLITNNAIIFRVPMTIYEGLFKCPKCGNEIIVTVEKNSIKE